MKEMFKNTFIILVITLVAGFLLGLIYSATKDTIALRKEEEKLSAYKEVFADATEFEEIDFTIDDALRQTLDAEGYSLETIQELLLAKAGDSDLGYVFTVTTKKGYGGDITFTVGIRNDGTMNGISLLSISETAGLGMNAGSVLVPQFANKQVSKFAYTKTGAVTDNEINAISGATITTRAITDGVNLSLYYFANVLGGVVNE